MYKILRIICCIISALCLAACVFVFVYLGTVWGITIIVGAGAFFALTVLFKKLQEDQEGKKPTTTPENAKNSNEAANGDKNVNADGDKK